MKYMHLRKRNAFDEVLPKGGITIATEVTYSNGETHVRYSVAYCSDKDTFSKHNGRYAASKYQCQFFNYRGKPKHLKIKAIILGKLYASEHHQDKVLIREMIYTLNCLHQEQY